MQGWPTAQLCTLITFTDRLWKILTFCVNDESFVKPPHGANRSEMRGLAKS